MGGWARCSRRRTHREQGVHVGWCLGSARRRCVVSGGCCRRRRCCARAAAALLRVRLLLRHEAGHVGHMRGDGVGQEGLRAWRFSEYLPKPKLNETKPSKRSTGRYDSCRGAEARDVCEELVDPGTDVCCQPYAAAIAPASTPSKANDGKHAKHKFAKPNTHARAHHTGNYAPACGCGPPPPADAGRPPRRRMRPTAL